MVDEKSTSSNADERRKSLVDIFRRINSAIPDDQKVLSIGPDVKAIVALDIMRQNGFSQLPIVEGKEVLGIFSYRSYANAVARMIKENAKLSLEDLSVAESFEQPVYARVTDEFISIIKQLDEHDAVIAGDHDKMQGIVATMDVLRYLHHIARPFVLIGEIELALRGLIDIAVEKEKLKDCIKNSLECKYTSDRLPDNIEELEFNDYIQILCASRNWDHFSPVFGGNRLRAMARLEKVRDLRNDIFHFKREISVDDYDALAADREWLLLRARRASGDKSKEQE